MTRRADPTQPISTIHMMAAGGFAGVFSWLLTYPIDFLKSRLQFFFFSFMCMKSFFFYILYI